MPLIQFKDVSPLLMILDRPAVLACASASEKMFSMVVLDFWLQQLLFSLGVSFDIFVVGAQVCCCCCCFCVRYRFFLMSNQFFVDFVVELVLQQQHYFFTTLRKRSVKSFLIFHPHPSVLFPRRYKSHPWVLGGSSSFRTLPSSSRTTRWRRKCTIRGGRARGWRHGSGRGCGTTPQMLRQRRGALKKWSRERSSIFSSEYQTRSNETR